MLEQKENTPNQPVKSPYELSMGMEDLSMDAERMATLTTTIYTAINYGPSTAEAYIESLTLLEDLLDAHAKKLKGLMDDCDSLKVLKQVDRAAS